MVGRTIGKYRVIEQIGRGGMGTVYKAIDETLDRRVAIKVLNADLIDQEAVERFRREAMTLAKLNHGRIGAIHELTRDGHDLLMVMEFLEGETFEKLIEKGPLPIPRAVTLCAQVLDALQYAHAAGVVHRDLKPANVIVTPSGDIKVMDFGIARVQGSEHLTTNGFMVGTPAYMAPEQVRGEEVDPRMDLYAVTVVLYRMLTQRLPFGGDTAIAMIHSQLHNPPTPISQFRTDLPEWLLKILERGLSKAPVDRFQSAAEFRAALEGGLTGKIKIPAAPPIDPDATMRPTMTPPAMRVPPTPSSVSPAPAASGSATLPPVTPSSATLPSATLPSVTPSAVTPSAVAAAPGTGVMPPLPPAPPAKAEATVTLRAPHLATAGILLTLLVVGVVILAVVALRRPATTVVAPSEVTAPVDTAPGATGSTDSPSAAAAPVSGTTDPLLAGATPGTTPAVTSATPPGMTPSAPATAGAATTGTAASAATSTRPAAPATSAAPTAAGTGRATGARGTTPPVSAAGTTAATITPPAAAPAPAAPPVPAAPAAASAPAENFGDVKALVLDGNRSREVDALLSLEPGNLVVRSRSDGSVLRTLPYTSVAAATYARAKRPRGQSSAGVAAVPENLGGSGFLGGDRHWLTLQTPAEFLIVRLEDRNVIRVLSSIEARTGNKIVRTQGE